MRGEIRRRPADRPRVRGRPRHAARVDDRGCCRRRGHLGLLECEVLRRPRRPDVVHPLVGEFEGLATRAAELGAGFGLRFAWATGLATTWTASNCASLALLPLLVVASRRRATSAAGMVLATVLAAAAVAGLYGAFIGRLGPEGATAWNGSNIRGAQSFIVFGALGVGMIVGHWPSRNVPTRLSRTTRAFFSRPATKAALAGGMVGAFTLGRPLAVFRQYLLYIAQPARIDYGALAMIVECLGALCIPMLLLSPWRGRRSAGALITGSIAHHSTTTICSSALALGGTFLLFSGPCRAHGRCWAMGLSPRPLLLAHPVIATKSLDVHRQRNGKRRAGVGIVRCRYPATVAFDDGAADRKAESSPSGLLVMKGSSRLIRAERRTATHAGQFLTPA